ncbi:ubiquitin-like-conjugating enzyme ATG10 [Brachyhypopomus gauderio]|uniref:ubiquitin-like-conjugating enzyme ATG10 n=1 Tax=Brachyhypopomus gauderio TaxID=698409 RepID=UPI0040428A1E
MMSDEEKLGTANCCLDQKTFNLCCQCILRHSSVLGDGWSWVDVKDVEEGYMKKTVLIPRRPCAALSQHAKHKPEEEVDIVTEEDQVDDVDGGAYAVCENRAVIHYEYHVLYSCSYQAPVLYFRASSLDGRPLSLGEVWNNVHPNYRQRLLQGPWDTLTQQEHPLLGQPFFMLHPCRTEEFIRPILQMAHSEKRRVNYVLAWLSMVGPVVGLDVPLSYSTEVTAPD